MHRIDFEKQFTVGFSTKVRQRFNFSKHAVILRPQIYFPCSGEVHVSVDYVLFKNRNLFLFDSLYRKKASTRLSKREKKMIGHRAHLRENDDIPVLLARAKS